MSAKRELGPAPVKVGARVEIREPARSPLRGTVRAVKPSSVSGWWAEVDVGDGVTWSFALEATAWSEVR